MFDLFRSRDKAVRYLLGGLLGLVALSMVITLIPGYGSASSRSDNDTIIAEIGKDDVVTVREVQKLIQDQIRSRQMPQEMAAIYAPQIIDQFINERALAYQAKRMGFTVSDQELADAIRGIMTRFTGGQPVDRAMYEQILNSQGTNIPEFEANMRKQMLLTRLQNVALEGVIVTPKEAEQEYIKRNTKAKIAYLAFKSENLKSQVTVTPQDVQAAFNGNKEAYRQPEKKNIVALVADQDKIAQSMQIPEPELRAAYNRNQEHFRTPERVKVRHILFQTTNKSADEVAKIKAKAEGVLKQIKGGADFAELAKANSDDPGSKGKGGDLDWVVRGQTVKNFENTAFSLKPKQISDLVQTEYGFHIIQVLDKQEARLQPFEEAKTQLAAEMKKTNLVEKVQNSIEEARTALQKNPGSYDQIASQLGLQVVKAAGVAPGAPIPDLGQSPNIDMALVSMKKGDVSPVVQVSPTKLAVFEVTEIVPSRIPDVSEVEAQIRDNLQTQKANQLAQTKAADAAKRLQAGESIESVAKALGVEVKNPPPFNSQEAIEGVGQAALLMDAFTKPVGSVIGPVPTTAGQVIVAKTVERTPPDMAGFAAARDQIVFQLKEQKATDRKTLFYDSVLTELIREKKVKKHQDTIQRLLASYRS